MPKTKTKAQPSMSVQREKQKREIYEGGQLPDDVGLLQDTFVMPTGRNRPSWFGDFKARLRLERYRLVRRIMELPTLVMWRVLFVRPRPKLHILEAANVGKKMHKDMYTAFALGDLKPVQGEICTGLLSSLRTRIAQRPPQMHLRWTLHKYLSQPKLVSYKAGLLPGANGRQNRDKEAQNGYTQAVIRIHSLQSLQHVKTVTTRDRMGHSVSKEVLVDPLGRELPASDDVEKPGKETVEYFVIQKQLKKSKEGPWMVWGTAEETTIDKVERTQQKKKELKQRRKEEKAQEKAGAAA